MKFETINGTLCRMVEPEPLTDDVKFPCVVRMIQDDSPMGRNNDFYATSHLLAHIEIINGLDAIHFVRWQGSKTYYSRFEIIGYPVEEGSHWWALYQMQNGKTVCNKNNHAVMFANEKSVSPCWNETWEQTISLYPNGWEIYEEPDHIEAINQTKSRGGTQIMKQCPECRAFYPEEHLMCPPCGVALISNEASSEDSNGGVFAPSSMYSVRYMGKDIITSVYHEREKEDYNLIPRTYVEIKDAQNPQRRIRIPMTGNPKIEARDALIGFMGEAYFHYLFPDLYEASFHEFIYFVLTKTW